MAHKIYDKNGKYIGKSEEDNPMGTLVVFVLGIWGITAFIDWLLRSIVSWETYEQPYRFIVGYYYYFFSVPLAFAKKLLLATNSLTNYPNLNLIISISVFISILATIYFLIKKAVYAGEKYRIGQIILALLFVPLFILIIWFLGESAASWLFAK